MLKFAAVIAVLIILFIVTIVAVIISGRILGQINKHDCTKDDYLSNAQTLGWWIVGLSSAFAALILVTIVGLGVLAFFVPTILAW